MAHLDINQISKKQLRRRIIMPLLFIFRDKNMLCYERE